MHNARRNLLAASIAASLSPFVTNARAGNLDRASIVEAKAEPDPDTALDGGFPQYLIEDDGKYGPTRVYWNSELEAKWPAYIESRRDVVDDEDASLWHFGNWTNANGDSNSDAAPYAQTPEMYTTSLPAVIEFEATKLVRRWITKNRGAYVRCSGTGRISVGGRKSEQSPLLIVTRGNGEKVTFERGHIACFSASSAAAFKTDIRAELGPNFRTLLHWRGITIPADMVSARIVLRGVQSSVDKHRPITAYLYETDIPELRAGGGGIEPEYGLAAAVGEDKLPGHPDVYMAGDFSKDNFFSVVVNGDLMARGRDPAPLANVGQLRTGTIPGFQAEWLPHVDGTTMLRTAFVHGNGTAVDTSGISVRHHRLRPVEGDPTYQIEPATVVDEMYARVYMMLEHDFFSTTDGVKLGLGFDNRIGYWAGSGWQQTTGNSGTPGTGLKRMGTRRSKGKAVYEGHSIRQHLGECRQSRTPYQKYRPLKTHCSNNGPYRDARPYGSEENMVSETTVLEKGKWHCIEWHIKMNSIEGPYDAIGNGVGVQDGILECWIDGVLSFRRDRLVWRRHPEFGVNGYWIVGVHGGVRPPAPGEVLHYRLNHLAVAKRYIGPIPA